jgi:hypothetical protein
MKVEPPSEFMRYDAMPPGPRLAFPNDLTYARANKPWFGLREPKERQGRTLAVFRGRVMTLPHTCYD